MGNRAVICLKDNNQETEVDDDDLGIYLHWSGSPDQVEHFLELARERMGDRLGDVSYGKARLLGVIHEQIEGNLSLGLDLCQYLDTDNGNNGTYVVNCATMTINTNPYRWEEK
jgi:hypothetical protein|tara:strand:+ start:655 stop:993 length:339 start_codon:yes stop_codon:yes gene_type:complete